MSSKSELEIITDYNIDLLLLNNYELYIYNRHKSGKVIEICDIYFIIGNKNCSLYFATYLLSTIFKYDIDKLYENLLNSKNLTIQDIKKIPIDIINDENNILIVSHNANLYYCDIVENSQYDFSVFDLCGNINVHNNFSYEDY